MHESLTNEPVSSATPAFRDTILQAIAEGQPVILLFRYANCAGAKDYFIARSAAEYDAVLTHARSKTSITAFFQTNFKLHGIADDLLCAKTIELLPRVATEYEGIDLLRVDGPDAELDDAHYDYCTTPEDIQDWFRSNRGGQFLAGTMEFWQDNCSQIITAYVPDDDGVVRPGAY